MGPAGVAPAAFEAAFESVGTVVEFGVRLGQLNDQIDYFKADMEGFGDWQARGFESMPDQINARAQIDDPIREFS